MWTLTQQFVENLFHKLAEELTYMHCRISNYQERKVAIQVACLTQPHYCACLKPGPGFPSNMSWSPFLVK